MPDYDLGEKLGDFSMEIAEIEAERKRPFNPPLDDPIQFAIERNDCECDVCARARVAAEQELAALRADRERLIAVIETFIPEQAAELLREAAVSSRRTRTGDGGTR